MADAQSGPSRAEYLLKIVQRFNASIRAFLRTPYQVYSIKVLKIGLRRVTAHLSEHYGLTHDIERQRMMLLLSCETVRREIDAGGVERPPPSVIANVHQLGEALGEFETLVRRYARPCSIP